MKILGIETSCDETALAMIDAGGDLMSPKFEVLGTALYSQIETHKPYGGVFPALAKREHSKNLIPLLNSLFEETGAKVISANPLSDEIQKQVEEILHREPELLKNFLDLIPKIARPNIDMIAVTSGPGLEPALWVGINFARALSLVWQIPVMPTNHMEGHIVSVLNSGANKSIEKIDEISLPAISLLISGGHTELVLVKNWGEYEIIGATKDDAVGEAFDKVARVLGLPYPGGPEISKLAAAAREENLQSDEVELPRPMIHTKDFDFSFSGIKTAVLYLTQKLEKESRLDNQMKKVIAMDFENAATEVLFKKTRKALDEYGAQTLIIGGGVIANKNIRAKFAELETEGIRVLIPEFQLATDNALMIAIAGFLKSFREEAKICPEIKAEGNMKL